MEIGIIGLGRMGLNMARRLKNKGHKIWGYNKTAKKSAQFEAEGGLVAKSLADMVKNLPAPRVLWIMVPAGGPTEEVLRELSPLLAQGDIVIDGGNTHYKDDIRRYKELKIQGIHYVDAGVSGGIWGLEEGYCLMAGGEREIFDYIEPIFRDLAPKNGYLYCGAVGAGHYVKMIHNGIEYGMMEAYGEGFELLKFSPYGKELNLAAVAGLWNRGSVIRSWLLDLLQAALTKDPNLDSIKGFVEDSGEGRWTVQEAVDSGISIPVIAQSLFKRFESRRIDLFSNKISAALRNEFGGHAIVREEKPHE